MGASLDLRKAWRHQRHGDLMVVLTWVNDQRSLVLAPVIRRDAGWYIVQESAAYLWGVDHFDQAVAGPARAHVARQSLIACQMLGIEPSFANRARIISIVTGWIPDLCAMPGEPQPTYLPGSFGEVQLRADGKPIAAEDIREVDAGVTYEVAANG